MDSEYFAGQKNVPGTRLEFQRAGLRLGLGRDARALGQAAFEKLFERAIHYGREGFLVSPTIAGQWEKRFPSSRASRIR